MKENKSPKDAAMYRKKDYVTNKLLLVFTLAFALLLLLMNVGRMMKSTATFMTAYTVVKIVAVAAVVLVAAGIVMIITEHSKKKDMSYRLFSGKNVTVAALFVAICAIALSLVFSQSMLMLLYIFVPAVVVLYIIYYSYQREFFLIALSCIIGGIGIWLLGSDLVNTKDVFAIAGAAALVILTAGFALWAQLGKGKIKLFGRELAVFKADARYGIIYLTCLLVLMLLAAAFLAPDLAMYFVFALIAYIVLTGVYYTVKLI